MKFGNEGEGSTAEGRVPTAAATMHSKQPNIVLRLGGWGNFFCRRGRLGRFGGDGTGEDFDFLFRVGEAVSAGLDEAHAFLVAVEEFLERELGVFHVGDDLFEAGEEVLEFFWRISGIWRRERVESEIMGRSFCLRLSGKAWRGSR